MSCYVAVIDGTGPWSDAEYVRSMASSFCRQLATQLGAAAHYYRGPSAAGLGVRSEASAAAEWLRQKSRQDRTARLMLAGYSRGASAAIYAAEFLAETRHNVDSMFLFDAVARHVFPGARCCLRMSPTAGTRGGRRIRASWQSIPGLSERSVIQPARRSETRESAIAGQATTRPASSSAPTAPWAVWAGAWSARTTFASSRLRVGSTGSSGSGVWP